MNKSLLLIIISSLFICSFCFSKIPSANEAKKDLTKLHKLLKEYEDGAFKEFNSNFSRNSDYIEKKLPEMVENYLEFADDDFEDIVDFLKSFQKKYGVNSDNVSKNLKKSLGKSPDSQSIWDYRTLIENVNKMKAFPKEMTETIIETVKQEERLFNFVTDTAVIRTYDRIKLMLKLAEKLTPDNKEIDTLADEIDNKMKKTQKAREKAINERTWEDHSNRFQGPGDPDKLARIAMKFLENNMGKDNKKVDILSLRIAGDWRVGEKNVLGQPINYALLVHVAFENKKDSSLATVMSLSVVTREAKPEPPFKTYWVGDSWKIKKSKVKTLGSSGPNPLFRLVLSFMLILAGLLAASSLFRKKIPAMSQILDELGAFRAVLGVITLSVGALFFVLNLFSPFSDILPQLAAITVGLLLGLELLVKPWNKKIADKSIENEKLKKAGQAVEDAAEKAQELLRKNADKIKKLETFQVPIGITSIVLGLFHLLVGGFIFF